MTEPIQCGVAGVGYLGQHHARIYAELEGAGLAGVYDTDKARAGEVARRHGCAVFSSLEELGRACQAASVVVPTDRHCEAALPLLAAGCHLLIEKPLCVNLEEAGRILKMAQDKDRIVQVGHIENYNPVMAFLEKNVDRPRYLTAERLAPFNVRGTEVGVVLDLMIHDIGVVLSLARSPVKRIESVGVNVLSPAEDIANARLVFENGCVANLNASRVSQKKVREIRVFQPRLYLSLNFMEQKGHLLRQEGQELRREEIPIEKAEPLKIELASFVDCVRREAGPKVGPLLGRAALDAALRITSQIRGGSA